MRLPLALLHMMLSVCSCCCGSDLWLCFMQLTSWCHPASSFVRSTRTTIKDSSLLHCSDCRLDDEFIADMIMTLLFAGHDTTSTSLTQLVATLNDHPAVIEKLRQEQEKMLAKHGEEMTPAVLKDMVYGEAVIR